MQLPKNWSEISVSQWIELKEIEQSELGYIELLIEKIALLADIAPDDQMFEDLDVDELLDIIESVKWINTEPSANYENEICGLKFKGFERIELGEFIDIEHFITDTHKHLPILCSIFYRNYKLNEWNVVSWEPLEYSLEERSKMFLDVPITSVYWTVKEYFKFRESFLEAYRDQFTDPNDSEIEDEDQLNSIELAELKKEIEEEKKAA